jgi:hypothetical protein
VPEYYLLLVLIMDLIIFVCKKNIIFHGAQIASVDYGWNRFCLKELGNCMYLLMNKSSSSKGTNG